MSDICPMHGAKVGDPTCPGVVCNGESPNCPGNLRSDRIQKGLCPECGFSLANHWGGPCPPERKED